MKQSEPLWQIYYYTQPVRKEIHDKTNWVSVF